VASDKDDEALRNLLENTSQNLKSKFTTINFDILKKFPFEEASFDGVFCTGTLHLFKNDKLKKILLEIERVLKRGGKLIFDYAIHIKRILPDGTMHNIKGEPNHTKKDADKIIRSLLKDYKLKFTYSHVPAEDIKEGEITYKFSCKFVLVVAIKK